MKRIIVLTLLVMMALFCPRVEAITITFDFEKLSGNINGQPLERGIRFFSWGALNVVSQGDNNTLSPSGYNDSWTILTESCWKSFSMDIYSSKVRSLSFFTGLLDARGTLLDVNMFRLTSAKPTDFWHFELNPAQMFAGLVFIDKDWCSDIQFDNIVLNTSSAPAPVPEPATLLLMGTGLVGLLGIKRFRKPVRKPA